MRAISLWQPWATLVAIGAKRIETRGWETLYRGPLAIHAAKKLVIEIARAEPFVGAIHDGGYHNTKDLPMGAVVATCELVGCVRIDPHVLIPAGPPLPPPEPERSFGDYRTGRFAWLLENVRRLSEPVPWRGAQGFFNVPDEVLLPAATSAA